MPPGYYIVVLCLLSISLVNARKSQRNNEWQHSNTMSRESGENHESPHYADGTIDIDNNQGYSEDPAVADTWGSGYGQNDQWGSGFNDDEDDDYDEYESSGGDRDLEYPGVVAPTRRPGAGTGVDREDPFVVEPPDENHDIIYDGPKHTETGSDSPVVVETIPKGEDEKEDEDEDDHEHGHSDDLSRSIIMTPGLLPGIIGGAVVGLLCAVLLVMFIVYRMRKKDEGSYALEEPKMTSPSRGYTRAPTKEYWA